MRAVSGSVNVAFLVFIALSPTSAVCVTNIPNPPPSAGTPLPEVKDKGLERPAKPNPAAQSSGKKDVATEQTPATQLKEKGK